MFWADDIVGQIEERFAKEIENGTQLIVRDEKTLSGRVHVGSLRGIVLHGLLAQVLNEHGYNAKCLFELNDNDPMDGLPTYIDKETFEPHMGKPLFSVPPVNEGDDNFATGFGEELKTAVDPMGIPIEWYPLRPLYKEGRFNDTIKLALENADAIRKIYKEVSGGEKADDWLPLNVICEQCGKIGTTKVTGWDGEKVTYECKPNYVTWAEGCGHCGSMSPFDGNATLPWKVEWAAKWKVLGVHIEAAGKDHYAAGGSREIAARISEEIFDYREPFGFLYEWLNIQGASMSSSKGVGISAKEMADLLPPALLKFLMIRKAHNNVIDFDPKGKTIPNLFDEYDRCSDHFFKRVEEPFDGYSRPFQLAQKDISEEPNDVWNMRFQALSFVVQMPHLDVHEEAEKLKGSALTDTEKASLDERAHYTKQWLDTLAPDQYIFRIADTTPDDFEVTDELRTILPAIADALEGLEVWNGPTIHEKIHDIKKEHEIAPKTLFQALYTIFLNRTSGPQVGWFLSTFEKNDVLKRLRSAVA